MSTFDEASFCELSEGNHEEHVWFGWPLKRLV
jgi:hypothetical protein